MDEGYTWRDMRDDGPSHLPGPEHLGWWIGVALVIALILHVLAFFALGHLKVVLGFEEAKELRTRTINVDPVEVSSTPLREPTAEPEAKKVENTADLLDEIDLLDRLPEDHELDLSPDVVDPSFALEQQQAKQESSDAASAPEMAFDFALDTDSPDMGRTEESLPPAAEGQVVVDPGSLELDDQIIDDFANQVVGENRDGEVNQLDGVVSLEEMVGLPENVLVGKKTMLPSDLLFEYNSAELRESARVGLMKLALIIERNAGLHCWIEGHTDLFGGETYNQKLSKQRAESVKSYLVKALRLSEDRIHTRGRGMRDPLVKEGNEEEQAPNRRVEIRMRRNPPADEAEKPKPEEGVEEVEEVEEAILVEPNRPDLEEAESAPPVAIPVEDEASQPPKALPVEEEIEAPRAIPVEEESAPPRALPVEE